MTADTLEPLATHSDVIRPEWIDYNGHMNLSYYVLVFDYATDRFLDEIGMTEAYREASGLSTFSAEIHVNYLRELHAGDPVRVTTQLLDYDPKRLHYFHRMYHGAEGWLAATNELLSLVMDMRQRRVGTLPPAIADNVARLQSAHAALPRPEQAGHRIGIPR